MAVLEILKYPEPILKKRAEEVEEVDDGIRGLISDMVETMYHAGGIGLAANQVGAGKRVIVLDVPEEGEEREAERGRNLMALINPEIEESEGSIRFEEGCLSVPGFTAYVERAVKVVIKGLNENGESVKIDADGLLAIALQHEIDHIDGVLFIDRLSRIKRDIIKRKYKKAMEAEKSSRSASVSQGSYRGHGG